MGNKTFYFSSKKKRIFYPKTTKFGPKLAFLVNLGQAMQAYSVPCWWVGWWLWRAGCISQDTYLLYILLIEFHLVVLALLLGHWYEIMALYYVKLILTEISASRQDRRVLQKSKFIRIKILSKWGMLQTSRYV